MSELKTTTERLSKKAIKRFECIKVGDTVRLTVTFSQNEVIDTHATANFALINARSGDTVLTGSVSNSILSLPKSSFTEEGIYYIQVEVLYNNGEVKNQTYKLKVFE